MSGRKKVGLALASGGGRGMAHIGVLKVLERAGIPAPVIRHEAPRHEPAPVVRHEAPRREPARTVVVRPEKKDAPRGEAPKTVRTDRKAAPRVEAPKHDVPKKGR